MESDTLDHPSDIAAVSTATGLAKDTLRVWERRYGFPQPERDAHGERVYPAEQVERLRVIRRLMDRGLRPGAIVGLPMQELLARHDASADVPSRAAAASEPGADQESASADGGLPPDQPERAALADVMTMLKQHRVEDMRQLLNQCLLRAGLQRFIVDMVVPLNGMVGEAWMQGRIQIFEEHLYTEQIKHLLRNALGNFPTGSQTPKVLLTTFPGEQHQLGLLMAHAFIAAEGAQCVSLGTETPVWDIVQAARAHRVDVVGLSFSAARPVRLARAALEDLRLRLDPAVHIWAGGSIWQSARKGVPGVTPVPDLAGVSKIVADWRANAGTAASTISTAANPALASSRT